MPIHRRTFLQWTPFALTQSGTAAPAVRATYPSHPPELAKAIVGSSHGKLDQVKELLRAYPTLAKASWDWGFGDWETALGAASHVGNRVIAELLIENGATPTLFSATMLGQLQVVRALIEASPGIQQMAGPHSISLLAHAKAGGERSLSVLDYLETLGDAGSPSHPALSEEAISAITGVYVFGPGPNDRIDISATKGQIEFKRIGADPRRLFHLGSLVFYPAGAGTVRIRFDGRERLTVHDPEVTLTGKRSK